jgi:hypothetical protein
MRIRLDYPLAKPLMPELKVKIKGRGIINIMLRYENAPHFCFTCGWMGHAAPNCEERDLAEQGVRFGEELRASPPRRAKEIFVQNSMPRAAKQPFHAGGQWTSTYHRQHGAQDRSYRQVTKRSSSKAATPGTVTNSAAKVVNAKVGDDLVEGVKEMKVACEFEKASGDEGSGGGKDQVSFGTNMSTEDGSSASESRQQWMQHLDKIMSRFQARKAATMKEAAKTKITALKVQGAANKRC